MLERVDQGDIATDPTRAAGRPDHARLRMLDGWRAISILLVLAGHMLPLGPARWELNAPVAALGMAIFFTLSGFLIVSILARDPNVGRFLVRRFARIVPLAWTVLAVVFLLNRPELREIVANFLFYANLPPFFLDYTGHFWSLCVEVQFYAIAALVVLAAGPRGLMLVPVAAIIVTGLRIWEGATISIVTWLRLDEILAGGCLALAIHHFGVARCRAAVAWIPLPLVVLAFALSSAELVPGLDYARPYLTALMVGLTVSRPDMRLNRLLESRPLYYLATVSYAVYIIHPYTHQGWMVSGGGAIKAAKRLLAFLLTFGFAHLSTFYAERPINRWAHRITAR
ncbi:acyltransferase family protein [Sphingomonas nostoxanthinifaciens]|uniref:acyltransferase family protein n=1 Tax=Sphingomonas nostoxanthinifaciens TaxID=2872652 RepID=UPI001CC1D5A1|nr:acyltransferase [Sphingomonas nostoxanthinifaciens]UAK23062.1 acyltransferase [Sphingomonas nostoxanthinifaciens]